MTSTVQATSGRTVGMWWLALSAVAMAAFAPRQYLTGSLHDLGAGGDVFAANYAAQPGWVQGALYVHIACAALALVLSPLQFSRRVRARVPRLHRTVGRVVFGCVLAGGTAGLVLAPSNMAGAIGTAGFGTLAILWITFAVAGVRAILRGDVPAHRRWMVRAFALTYAGVMLRLWMPVLVPVMGGDLLAAYQLVPFLCWVPNLVVAELVLRRRPAAVPA
jgi:uncharacterized membrane protein